MKHWETRKYIQIRSHWKQNSKSRECRYTRWKLFFFSFLLINQDSESFPQQEEKEVSLYIKPFIKTASTWPRNW